VKYRATRPIKPNIAAKIAKTPKAFIS